VWFGRVKIDTTTGSSSSSSSRNREQGALFVISGANANEATMAPSGERNNINSELL